MFVLLYELFIFSGKTMESTRNYRKMQLVFDLKKLEKLTRKAEYISHKVFHANLAAIELINTEVFMNKPIYSGFAVLEISKEIMYRFHYKVSIFQVFHTYTINLLNFPTLYSDLFTIFNIFIRASGDASSLPDTRRVETSIHRHGFTCILCRDGRSLRCDEYATGGVRFLESTARAPIVLTRQQDGTWQNEGRQCRLHHGRIRRASCQGVLLP